MPRTPRATRPMERTPSSGKVIALPPRVPSMMRFSPSVNLTPMSSSSSSRLTARRPFLRMLPNSESGVFLTTPCLVPRKR